MIVRRSRRNAEPFGCTLHQHAAAIHRIDFAAGEIKFTQAIQRPRDRRLGNVQLGRQTAHGVATLVQVAGEENAQLTGRQIGTISADQRDNRITQQTDLGIRYWIWRRCHDQ